MWKFILAGVLSLCLGGSSALAQSGRLPLLRNEAASRYQFVFVCARATGSITLDPARPRSLTRASATAVANWAP